MAVFRAEMIGSLFVAILMILSQVNCDDSAELEAYFGQEGTRFGDKKSCDRICDGLSKICYYKFIAEHYNAMGSRCGDCLKNVTSDCFNHNCVLASGRERVILTINRRIPGPTISACQGDEIIVDLDNRMSGSAVSIHWHGLHHVHTPWMDGVPMVTQCPVLPGNTFRYRFFAEPSGTHYWHAHTGVQRAEGLFGKFIVRTPKYEDPNGHLYDFDENLHTIMLTDWMKKMAAEFVPGTTLGRLKVDSILIDGIGCDKNRNETNCDVMPLPTYLMVFDQLYRWRIDNSASQNCPLELTIEGHRMTLIATDGFPIKPRTIDALVSSSGERHDVVIHAAADITKSEFLLRVRGLGNCEPDEVQAFARIILVENLSNYKKLISHARPYPDRLDYNVPFKQNALYLNNPAFDCRSSVHLCAADLEQNGVAAPCGQNLRDVVPNREIPLRFSLNFSHKEPSSFLAIGPGTLTAQVNQIKMVDAPFPVLTQDDSSVTYCNESTVANKNADEGFHSCTHVIQIELNEIVDFLLFDKGPRGRVSHPIHLHGHGFQVIDMGTLEEYNSNTTPYGNDTHPPNVKDTVVIPSGGFTRIRFQATNPGFWYMHCHFEWHMHVGMRLIIKVGNKSQMRSPPKGFPTCGHYTPSIYR